MGTPKTKTRPPAKPKDRTAAFRAAVQALAVDAGQLAARAEQVAAEYVRLAADPCLGPLHRELVEALWAIDLFLDAAEEAGGP